MKKALLLSGLLMSGVLVSNAFTAPKEYAGASFQGISPNGRYLASSTYTTVVIYDLQTGQEYEYIGDDITTSYSEGLGNYVSDTGVVLGSTRTNSDAAYWENGEWHQLAVPDEKKVNLSQGITPDGSRICGNVGVAAISIEGDNLMQIPVYWDRLDDGTYGEYHLLPHPDLDFTGRVPQYVTAISISADGKTIVGQVVDCAGMFCIPIVYQQDDSGNWSYNVMNDLVNPDHLTFPEFPGDGPIAPAKESYMTPEEKAAYQAAYDAYVNSGYDVSLYPEEDNYLSDEGKAAYEAAMAAYETESAAWDEAYGRFMSVYYSLQETSPVLEQNAMRISPDGKTAYATKEEEDNSDPMAWFPTVVYKPMVIDIAEGTAEALDFGKSLMAVSVPTDGVILAGTGIGSTPMEGYIIANGTCTSLLDYLAGFSTELKAWMDEHLTHEAVIGYDPETYDPIYGNLTFTGNAVASADLKTFAFWNDCQWGNDYAYGYVVDLRQFDGIDSAAAELAGVSVGFDAAGNLAVTGDVDTLSLYDLSGRCVFTATSPRGTVACGLASGVYLVRATTAAGVYSTKLAK